MVRRRSSEASQAKFWNNWPKEALLAAQEANDDLALGWANLYQGWALKSLGDHEGAATTLHKSALAFDRAGYSAGAAQARSIASEAVS